MVVNRTKVATKRNVTRIEKELKAMNRSFSSIVEEIKCTNIHILKSMSLCFDHARMQSKTFVISFLVLGLTVVTLQSASADAPPYNPQPLPEYGEPPAKSSRGDSSGSEETPRRNRSVRKQTSQRYSRTYVHAKRPYRVHKEHIRKHRRYQNYKRKRHHKFLGIF